MSVLLSFSQDGKAICWLNTRQHFNIIHANTACVCDFKYSSAVGLFVYTLYIYSSLNEVYTCICMLHIISSTWDPGIFRISSTTLLPNDTISQGLRMITVTCMVLVTMVTWLTRVISIGKESNMHWLFLFCICAVQWLDYNTVLKQKGSVCRAMNWTCFPALELPWVVTSISAGSIGVVARSQFGCILHVSQIHVNSFTTFSPILHDLHVAGLKCSISYLVWQLGCCHPIATVCF